jgi:hypothetical protein
MYRRNETNPEENRCFFVTTLENDCANDEPIEITIQVNGDGFSSLQSRQSQPVKLDSTVNRRRW